MFHFNNDSLRFHCPWFAIWITDGDENQMWQAFYWGIFIWYDPDWKGPEGMFVWRKEKCWEMRPTETREERMLRPYKAI